MAVSERGQQFSMGKLVATASLLAELERVGGDPRELLPLIERHLRADWGTVDEHDWLANDRALVSGARVLSAYELRGMRVWIITDAATDACGPCWTGDGECEPGKGSWLGGTHFRDDLPPQRVSTTILRPEDY